MKQQVNAGPWDQLPDALYDEPEDAREVALVVGLS